MRFNPKRDYPFTSKRPDLLKTLSGENFQDITLENVASGEIGAQEIRIRAETLELQAKTAEARGRPQMAPNFRRAAELTRIPDEKVSKENITGIEIAQILNRFGLQAGESVLVAGPGPIGLISLAAAKTAGARIVGITGRSSAEVTV